MRKLPGMRSWSTAFCLLLAFLTLSPTGLLGAQADDIPHENYSLVHSNLDVVISLLRSTIRFSELALMGMYNESMDYVEQNLTVVRGLLMPADRLLAEIRDVAESYSNLSKLLPPFSDLSLQMDHFAVMETSLLEARSTVVSASKLPYLTGDDLLRAIDAINSFNSLVTRMNRTIDDMLISAGSIISLIVDDIQPFTDNQLIPLIEKLRDLLNATQYEVDLAVREGIKWNATEPFIMLWLSAADYYLGESIVGGGYLYYNGSFVADHEIIVLIDGASLTSVLTSSNGRYSFSYPIPLNTSWLGPHDIQSTAAIPTGQINSNVLSIRILLVPTTIALFIDSDLLSYEDHLTASVTLKESRGQRLANVPCHFILDESNVTFSTDVKGEFERSWSARELGFGTHTLQAFYEGELPYAPSASAQMAVTVNIPTSLEIHLVSSRFPEGHDSFIVANGTLMANGTEPLPDQSITISIDGVVVYNATTDEEGRFALSIPTRGMILGGHTLTAEFLHRDVVWRYSSDEVGFTIYGLKQRKYPFFPVIPGWGGGLPQSFPYLFIGPYAYYFWLLVLLLIAVSVRLLQTMKHRRLLAEKSRSEVLEPLDQVTGQPSAPPVSAEDFAREIEVEGEGAATPNERIIWYYQRLLAFLTRRENLSLKASMTHWEVARMLKLVGYPSNPVDRITVLFERALYSGFDLSDMDTIQMSASLTNMVTIGIPEAPHAV